VFVVGQRAVESKMTAGWSLRSDEAITPLTDDMQKV
jgi:hypothetical protein